MSQPEKPRTLRYVKIGLAVAVLSGLLISHQLGLLEHFADATELRRSLVGLGPWGYLAFIVSYALFQPFGVPGTVFVIAAPLIWPWPVAFALSMVGTMAASVIGFSFARFIARDWVAERIPKRFEKYDEALAKRGFATVALLRFIFWMPQVLHWFLGVSKVSFWRHFWGSLVGYMVPLFLLSYFGEAWVQFLMDMPLEGWIAMIVVAMALGVVWWRRGKPTATPL